MFAKNGSGSAVPLILTDDGKVPVDATVTLDAGAAATAAPPLPAGGLGLIGWLAQTAVSIMEMSAKLPASLGIKTAAGSLSVAPASDAKFALATAAGWAQVDINRQANTTPYAAGDVVGGVVVFPGMGSAGAHCMITSLDLRPNISAIPAGMSGLRLYLYRASPPSALADNAPWDLGTDDRAVFVGYIDISAPVDLGGTLFSQLDAVNKQVKLGAAETALYGYLVTTAAYTPAAVSEVYVATLRTVAL